MKVELIGKKPKHQTLNQYKGAGLFTAQSDDRVILSLPHDVDGHRIVLFDKNKVTVVTDKKTIECWQTTYVEPYDGKIEISNENLT